VVDALDQFMGFVTGKCFDEIRADPFFQVLGLANIEQYIIIIVVFVNTR
jgi:hypothetical protein